MNDPDHLNRGLLCALLSVCTDVGSHHDDDCSMPTKFPNLNKTSIQRLPITLDKNLTDVIINMIIIVAVIDIIIIVINGIRQYNHSKLSEVFEQSGQ